MKNITLLIIVLISCCIGCSGVEKAKIVAQMAENHSKIREKHLEIELKYENMKKMYQNSISTRDSISNVILSKIDSTTQIVLNKHATILDLNDKKIKSFTKIIRKHLKAETTLDEVQEDYNHVQKEQDVLLKAYNNIINDYAELEKNKQYKEVNTDAEISI